MILGLLTGTQAFALYKSFLRPATRACLTDFGPQHHYHQSTNLAMASSTKALLAALPSMDVSVDLPYEDEEDDQTEVAVLQEVIKKMMTDKKQVGR